MSTAPVASDAAGNLAVDYVLVNGIRDYYRLHVLAQDGTDLASTGFTDLVACQLTVNPSLPAGGSNFTTISSVVYPNPGPCIVTVSAGTYNESVSVDQKNTSATGESQRIVIQADPTAAVGAVKVVATGTSTLRVNRSKYITLRGFDVSGPVNLGIDLSGSNGSSTNITIDSNIVHDTGTGNLATAGVNVAPANFSSWIVNNLVHHAGQGISVTTANTAYVVNNTIYANAFNGIQVNATTQDIHVMQ